MGDNNNNDDGPDDANASSGPLGKFFYKILLKIQLILSFYYRSYQQCITTTCHVKDDTQRRRMMTTTCHVKNDDIQRRCRTTTCHVNETHDEDDDGPDDVNALSRP